MPVIKVWCLPKCGEKKLNAIFAGIIKVIESVKEFGLKGERAVTVLFPPDQMAYGLGSEIIIEVTGLSEKPERDGIDLQRLAQALGVFINSVFPDAKVECLIFPFNPLQGFWSSDQ